MPPKHIIQVKIEASIFPNDKQYLPVHYKNLNFKGKKL